MTWNETRPEHAVGRAHKKTPPDITGFFQFQLDSLGARAATESNQYAVKKKRLFPCFFFFRFATTALLRC